MTGDAAILVDPYDPAAISGAIRKLLENPVAHETCAEKGMGRVKEYSWDKMAEATLKVYEDLVGG